MMAGIRIAAAVALMVGAIAATRLSAPPLAALVVVAFAAHGFAGGRWRATLRAGIPVALFAATVAALQWINHSLDWAVPPRTLAVFLLSTLAMRTVPWVWVAGRLSPRSRLYLPGLFLLFVRHFTEILISETRRTLQARAMCVPSLFRAGGFSSLGSALVSIFRRALGRAERFYAAQSLSGIAQ
jgi:hypothetical protein